MSSLYAWRRKTRRGDIRACGAHSRISNTDTKLLIYGLVQKGRVLAQDGNFEVDRPDRLWVADITYVPTWSGFLFLAVVLDAFSRRIVGWAMATHLRTSLVLSALDMALFQRQARRRHPSLGPGHAVHVTSVRPAMPGGRGATVDGFGRGLLRQCDVRELLATLECELIERRSFRSHAEARMATFDFIEGWYNRDADTPPSTIARRPNSKGGTIAPLDP